MAHFRYSILYNNAATVQDYLVRFVRIFSFHLSFCPRVSYIPFLQHRYNIRHTLVFNNNFIISMSKGMGKSHKKLRDSTKATSRGVYSPKKVFMPITNASSEEFADRVLTAIENLDRKFEVLQEKINNIIVEAAVMKVKIAFFSALGGIVAGSAASVIVSFITRK